MLPVSPPASAEWRLCACPGIRASERCLSLRSGNALFGRSMRSAAQSNLTGAPQPVIAEASPAAPERRRCASDRIASFVAERAVAAVRARRLADGVADVPLAVEQDVLHSAAGPATAPGCQSLPAHGSRPGTMPAARRFLGTGETSNALEFEPARLACSHQRPAGTTISPIVSVMARVCWRAVIAAAMASLWSWLVRAGTPSRPRTASPCRLQAARVCWPRLPCQRVHEAVGKTSITSAPQPESASKRARPSRIQA